MGLIQQWLPDLLPGSKVVEKWRLPTEVKERAQLRLYFHSGSSWSVLGLILPCFTFNLTPYLLEEENIYPTRCRLVEVY
jgi:hypothetical protein